MAMGVLTYYQWDMKVIDICLRPKMFHWYLAHLCFVSHDFMAGVEALSQEQIELTASILKVSRTNKLEQIYSPVSNKFKAA